MTFTSLPFFAFFGVLWVTLAIVKNDVARRWILLLASLFFYGYWNAWYLLLILAVTVWSWWCGLAIEASASKRQRTRGVAIGTTLSLLALGIFKYLGFVSSNVATFTGGGAPRWIAEIVLPVGISFYTFHSISYYVDVYRGKVRAWHNLRDYALYIVFFPQLVAGPIVRAAQFLPQLEKPIKLTWANFQSGAQLFIFGMAQKLLLADIVSPFVDHVFASPALYSGATAWLAVFAYAVQIFGDFSGYTLIAIGVARILGFELPENFRMPYLATSITDFWRRWHITLSFFLRDYLYISLGGNRRGFLRTQMNTMITMLLGGLWHGASWNFVIWGGLHGGAIVAHHAWERLRGEAKGGLVTATMGWLLTLLFVVLAWIPFRASSFSVSAMIFERLFTLPGGVDWYHTPTLLALAAFVVWHLWYLLKRHYADRVVRFGSIPAIETLVLTCLIVMFMPLKSTPFIYFQF